MGMHIKRHNSAMFTHRQQREIFHFLFLERLLRVSDPRAFVLKGGTNLRFFFSSPRYSEDMDLDVLAGAVGTLRKNGYRILQDPAFARALATYGVAELIVGDPAKAKQTATTQRFRARLVTVAGESYPTKVEFSRRPAVGESVVEMIHPSIAERYRRLAFPCRHYSTAAACQQKMLALANRREVQSRDAFDLYVLWLGGHAKPGCTGSLTQAQRERATETLFGFTYEDYAGQVLDYLEPDQHVYFADEARWAEVIEQSFALVEAAPLRSDDGEVGL